MSAFIVSSKHIDALLTFAQNNGIAFKGRVKSLNAVGQCLVNENYRSVNYRYGEDKKPPKYIFKPYPKPIPPIQAIKALWCLDYQCCELKKNNPRYNHIYKLINDIASYKVIEKLPEYEAADWSID